MCSRNGANGIAGLRISGGHDEEPRCIIVMGVSGTGKSTLGIALAKELDMPFIDGDDFHPASNVAKMSAGQPLTDEDREPWLGIIRSKAEKACKEQLGRRASSDSENEKDAQERGLGVVIGCSSLKRHYREILRGKKRPITETDESSEQSLPQEIITYFVYIKGDRELLLERMLNRQGHFMKANMLDSQLETLEDPEGEEGVVVVSARQSTEDQVRTAMMELDRH